MDTLAAVVDAGARPFVTHDAVPGMVVKLIAPGDARVLRFGRISGQDPGPPGEDTLFGIASISKVFTAVALADMVWNGRIGLSDPVAHYLELRAFVPSKDGVQMRVVHLATHTSGLPVGRPGDSLFRQIRFHDPLLWKILWKRYVLRREREVYSSLTWDDLYAPLSRLKLERVPGEKWEYSNIGMGLLGHVLEIAERKTFEDIVLERVCRPLGLKRTAVTVPEGWADPVMHMKLGPLTAAGGMYSTARDLSEFVSAAAGAKATPLEGAFDISLKVHVQDKDGKQLRLGWQTHPETGRPYHLGGNHAFIGYDPATRTGAVILCTGELDKLEALGHAVLDVMSGRVPVFPKPRIAIDLEPEKLARYAGEYVMKGNDRPVTVTVDSGMLVARFRNGGTAVLRPENETEFFCREWDCQFAFRIDGGRAAGAAVSMHDFKGFYDKTK